MTVMEYRAYIELPTFPGDPAEGAPWDRLLDHLGANTDMGPVLDGPAEDGSPGVTLILATDADDESAAVRTMIDATTLALEAIGQAEHYPHGIEVERADDDALVVA